MTILDIKHLDEDETEDMAQSETRRSFGRGVCEEIRQVLVSTASISMMCLPNWSADKRAKAADVVAIAHGYAKGRKPKSKTDALTAIRKRFVELRQIETLSENAEKARPW